MILGLYAIKDELSNYGTPQAFQTDEVATRYMKRLTEEPGMIKSSPADFSIWKIGEYETDTGVITGYTSNEITLVHRANDFVKGE